MEKFKFLGIGGALNIKFGGNSCYFKKDDNLVVIDPSEGATLKLDKAGAFKNIKDAYIVITHTHFDHIGGIGILIWYLKFVLKITPKVIYKTNKYKKTLETLFKVTEVKDAHYEFMKDSDFKLGDLRLELQKTTHTDTLDCFGVMFSDNDGKYYYSGDTNDIAYIKKLNEDSSVKTIYCEVFSLESDAHIFYDDIKDFDKSKFVLMHFNSEELYNKAKKDGFKTGM